MSEQLNASRNALIAAAGLEHATPECIAQLLRAALVYASAELDAADVPHSADSCLTLLNRAMAHRDDARIWRDHSKGNNAS